MARLNENIPNGSVCKASVNTVRIYVFAENNINFNEAIKEEAKSWL